MKGLLTIGEVARQTEVPSKTIRYYEEAGLIPAAHRATNGYRVYDEQSIHLLRFIKRSRNLGFSIQDVRELLALWSDDHRASSEVRVLAARHLNDIEHKIESLNKLRATLQYLVEHCHGNDRPDCPILDSLAEDTLNKG